MTYSIQDRNDKGQFLKGWAKHGKSYSREYRVWWDMMNRCHKPNTRRFNNYGGRGVFVCERWHKFENFYADMGDRPSNKHSIERIDNNSGYSPENCKWATRKEQYANRRTNIYLQLNGKTLMLKEVNEKLGLGVGMLSYRVKKYGITHQAALDRLLEGRDYDIRG